MNVSGKRQRETEELLDLFGQSMEEMEIHTGQMHWGRTQGEVGLVGLICVCPDALAHLVWQCFRLFDSKKSYCIQQTPGINSYFSLSSGPSNSAALSCLSIPFQ